MPIQAARFALLEMARWSRHARSAGPNRSWLSSQCSSRGEDRAKQPRARMMRIVVGSRGTNVPTEPIPTLMNPRSEERHIGKESVSTCCSRWHQLHIKKNTKIQSYIAYNILI